MGPPVPLRVGVFYRLSIALSIAATALAPQSAAAIAVNGDLTYTSDYVFRGLSQTAGRSAGQIDVHAMSGDGTFLGVFASTLDRAWRRGDDRLGWDYELEEYLGHRFDVSPSWSTTFTAVNYSYLKGNAPMSNDYQELSAAFSYLDLWTITLSGIPNAVRYDGGYRMGRYPAYTADASAQLPISGRLFFTAGTGYYTSDNTGYAYGNAGLAFEYKSFRVDAGYYVAQQHAHNLFPYGRAGSRFACSVSWHF